VNTFEGIVESSGPWQHAGVTVFSHNMRAMAIHYSVRSAKISQQQFPGVENLLCAVFIECPDSEWPHRDIDVTHEILISEGVSSFHLRPERVVRKLPASSCHLSTSAFWEVLHPPPACTQRYGVRDSDKEHDPIFLKELNIQCPPRSCIF
jgi:hypothetical protein